MRTLGDITLVPASVPRSATFGEAAEVLASESLPTVAVVDEEQCVVGLFGGEELLRGLFPPYLSELRHTAFAADDPALLMERASEVASQPVARHMRDAITLDADTSATHVAERFLHCELDALPVVEKGRFVGMLVRTDFCRSMLRRA